MFEKKFLKENKKGISLAEVIVTIGIFSIIMVGLNQFFVSSWKNYNLVIHTSEASVAANVAMSKMIDALRRMGDGDDGSYAIFSASSTELRFFCDIDKDGVMEKAHYYLSGGNLNLGTSNPSGFPLTYPATDSNSEVLVKNIANSGTNYIFYYYDGSNNLIANPGSNLSAIRMIEVNLFIDRKEGDLNIKSFASLRNLSEHDTIE